MVGYKGAEVNTLSPDDLNIGETAQTGQNTGSETAEDTRLAGIKSELHAVYTSAGSEWPETTDPLQQNPEFLSNFLTLSKRAVECGALEETWQVVAMQDNLRYLEEQHLLTPLCELVKKGFKLEPEDFTELTYNNFYIIPDAGLNYANWLRNCVEILGEKDPEDVNAAIKYLIVEEPTLKAACDTYKFLNSLSEVVGKLKGASADDKLAVIDYIADAQQGNNTQWDVNTEYLDESAKSSLRTAMSIAPRLNYTSGYAFALNEVVRCEGKFDHKLAMSLFSRPEYSFLYKNLKPKIEELGDFEDRDEALFWHLWALNNYNIQKYLLSSKESFHPMIGDKLPSYFFTTLNNVMFSASESQRIFLAIKHQKEILKVFFPNEEDAQTVRDLPESASFSALANINDLRQLGTQIGNLKDFFSLPKDRQIAIALQLPPQLSRSVNSTIIGITDNPDVDDYTRGSTAKPNRTRRNSEEKEQNAFENLLKANGLSTEAIEEVKKYLVTIEHVLNGDLNPLIELYSSYPETILSLIESIDRDFSTKGFTIYHRKFDREREIPPFLDLLRMKIKEYYKNQILGGIKDGTLQIGQVAEQTLRLYADALGIYKMTSESVVPTLKKMNTFLQRDFPETGLWFSGRDGIPLMLAIKSRYFGAEFGTREEYQNTIRSQIGQDPKRQQMIIQLAKDNGLDPNLPEAELLEAGINLYLKEEAKFHELVKLACISRTLFENCKTEEELNRVKEYLIKIGVTPEMLAVDTGYGGSVIKQAMILFGKIDADFERSTMLLRSSNGNIVSILSPRNDADTSPVQQIENLPKKTDRTIYIDSNLEPLARQSTPDLQLLNWVSDHAIMRNLAPRLPQSEEEVTQRFKTELTQDIDALGNINADEKAEVQQSTEKLYERSKEFVAPAIVAFADHVLRQASKDEKNPKVVFLARDAVGSLEAAQLLLDKFPEQYPGLHKDQLKYLYITRKVVSNSGPLLERYLEQEGINRGDNVMLVDIGMYGTLLWGIKDAIGDYLNVTSTEYLISRTNKANGFLDSTENRTMNIFDNIPGNPAIHFLEDTFSGNIPSPPELVEKEGKIVPSTLGTEYAPSVALKRKYALSAIRDYVASMKRPEFNLDETRNRLNTFLWNTTAYMPLMVPHER